MAYKCQYCGFKLPPNSYHTSTDDIQIIMKHDKECPKRPKKYWRK